MINDKIDQFVTAYRDSLDQQKEAALQNVENNRRNQFQSMMGTANRAGMMYSNFPERAKIQYDTGTYMPAVTKINQTYQTGLDKLRDNTVNLKNQLASINEAISDLNESNSGTSVLKSNKDANADFAYDNGNVTFYQNGDVNDKIRFGSYAKRLGVTDDATLLDQAKKTLPASEYNKLANIYNKVRSSSGTFDWNVGKTHQDYTANVDSKLTQEELDTLNYLGLKLR